MFKPINTKSIFMHWQTPALLGVFIGLRVLSLILFEHPAIQAVLMFGILLAFAVLYFQNIDYAWMVLLGEFFLGGAGHFLELFGLSLRSMLTFTFIGLWLVQHLALQSHRHKLHIKHTIFYLFIPFAIFVTIGIFLGLHHGHGFTHVLRDAVPYSFFVLILPLAHHLKSKHSREYLTRLILVFLLGSALFSIITFFLYSSGIGALQDTFYHWYRDVAMGKITDMGLGFFRIVAPEHLLVVPGVLLIASLLMRDEKHHKWWRMFLLLGIIILVLNLSRTYLLALGIGLLVLKYKHTSLRWLTVSTTIGTLTMVTFFGTSLLVSGGQTLGLSMLSNRFGSITHPTTEVSTYTRIQLLPPITSMIQQHPVFGHGLGASLSFFDQTKLSHVETTQFDWGYLELFVELGILGGLSYLIILLIGVFELNTKIRTAHDYQDFYVGLLAGLISLIIMHVTAPVLSHVLGVFLLVLIFGASMKSHHDMFDGIVEHLYRVFHKPKLPNKKS